MTATPPRRFQPQLVETITISSKSKPRSLCQLAEKSVKSSQDPEKASTGNTMRLPQNNTSQPAQLTEDDARKVTQAKESAEVDGLPSTPQATPAPSVPRSFLEMEEDEAEDESTEAKDDSNEDDAPPLLPHEMSIDPTITSRKPARRKFKPQLIETAKRTRRLGDTTPTIRPADKTNVCPGDTSDVPRHRPRLKPPPPSNTPVTSALRVPQWKAPPVPNRQGSIRPHYNTRVNTRQHSFKVPTLEAIESSGSEKSTPPVASRQQSITVNALEDASRAVEGLPKNADDRFSGYLLALAAVAAQKQLREQAAAAFVNSDVHEGVAHYIDRDSSDEDVGKHPRDATRRDSSDDKWALQEMQRHGEWIRKQQQRKKTAAFNVEFDSEPSNKDAWITHSVGGLFSNLPNGTSTRIIGGYQRDLDIKQMRKAASPPMLGGDIEFPRCPSPEHARFDVTQGAHFLRNAMCYLTEQSGKDDDGLWDQGKHRPTVQPEPSNGMWGNSNMPPSKAGLWGGFCTDSDAKVVTAPIGLVTPVRTPTAVEKGDPFAASFTIGAHIAGPRQHPQGQPDMAPPSPPSSSTEVRHATADELLEVEAEVEAEFDDKFVTQVYNYLSLGYPSLASRFDEELSRISGVSVDELRQDDSAADARGYVRLEGYELGAEDIVEGEMCSRWRALRRYVKEWGRQCLVKGIGQPAGNMGPAGDPHRAWGLPARRGSWGI